jgi:hypothetical protein
MAIDLERSTLYIHKNGEWVTGNPSMASGGISLKPNREYVAVVAVGSPEKKSSSDAWTANFGASVFRYSMPQGYQGYGLGK